jgi:hypothetical protein
LEGQPDYLLQSIKAAPLFNILARALAPAVATSNCGLGELRLIGGGGADDLVDALVYATLQAFAVE